MGTDVTLFRYYACVFLEVLTKTNILFRVAGLWTQTFCRDLGNKKQPKGNCAAYLIHDQCAEQRHYNKPIKCETF